MTCQRLPTPSHCSAAFPLALLGLLLSLAAAQAARAADSPSPWVVESVVLRPLQVAEVPAEQTGLLREFAIDEGERVEAGQLLARLDARSVEHAVRQAQLEYELAVSRTTNEVPLRYAEKALEVARAELERSTESVESFAKSISQSQLDVERLTVEKLQLEIEQARHDLAIARFEMELKKNTLSAAHLRRDVHDMRAPFTGTVALVHARVGEWVTTGSPILRLVAVDRLRAEGFLLADVVSAARGMGRPLVGRSVEVMVTVAKGRTEKFSGTLRYVSPEMDPVGRQVRVWAEVDNSDRRLTPGQQARMVLEEGSGGKAFVQ